MWSAAPLVQLALLVAAGPSAEMPCWRATVYPARTHSVAVSANDCLPLLLVLVLLESAVAGLRLLLLLLQPLLLLLREWAPLAPETQRYNLLSPDP